MNLLTWELGKKILGVAVGAGLGYAYYHFIGCSTGSCPITSNWWSSTAYGAVLGLLVTW